jgi:hypothetical protein
MRNEARNFYVVATLIAVSFFCATLYALHTRRVEAHNTRLEIEADRRALQDRADRMHAFREKCHALEGDVPLRCPDLCVRGTAIVAVTP